MHNEELSERNQGQPPTMSRRGFLEWMLGIFASISALSVVATALAYLIPPSAAKAGEGPVAVADETDFPVGAGRVVPFKDTKVLVIHTAEKFVVLSAICTHAGCIVEWQPDKKQIYCPCHGGVFDLEGNVVGGPPPRPLPQYQVSVQDGQITVAKA